MYRTSRQKSPHPDLSYIINGIRPWNAEIKVRYEELFATTSQNRGSLPFLTSSMNSADKIAYTGTKNLYNTHSSCGAVAHLGERFNGIEEVESSILSSSTTIIIRHNFLITNASDILRPSETMRFKYDQINSIRLK